MKIENTLQNYTMPGADPALTCAGVLVKQTDLVPELVGKVYEEAPATVRGRLLEHLLKPLGILSLVAVANGVFAKISTSGGWSNLRIRPEDAQNVKVSDVIVLVNYVQQVSVQALDGLTQILVASPVLSSSAAAAMLLALLSRQAQERLACVGNDFDVSTGK